MRKGKSLDGFPHEESPNNVPAMATTQIWVLFVLLSVSLAEEVKLNHKPATKPVRLFTEEELQRYDGSEVNSYRNNSSVSEYVFMSAPFNRDKE